MDTTEKDDILRGYYFKEKNPPAYSGAQKLYSILQKKYPGVFSIIYIKQWLSDQDSYSLQTPR